MMVVIMRYDDKIDFACRSYVDDDTTITRHITTANVT